MSETITLAVRGMSCAHCVRAVTEAIRAEDPAAEVAVSLEAGQVTARTRLPRARVAALIAAEGYEAL
ncbi:heavy-metal-associated domain-containing protein [Roseomonas sp. KE0001]|uniref:heavy-metal-associated domain-containing protein n=1 Tax=unclassified Roseomonas TaxID=2617492 RepID=UPI0018DF0F8A|nr:cation transporter [Roseomonas sp. KE0001]MBI0433055.1 copper chaperone [Roseomonas sp. KE0001]